MLQVPPAGAGTETVLYSFCSKPKCGDGGYPRGIIENKAGKFYGTTRNGGSGWGTVFKLAPDGTERVLHSFAGRKGDGCEPLGVVMDSNGNLFGDTYSCGSNSFGTVFEVTVDGAEKVLYSFCPQSGCLDGQSPSGRVVVDSAGNVYGTTTYGGSTGYGQGTVFKVAPDGTETVIHSFGSVEMDGYYPLGGVTADAAGNLFGTAQGGVYGRGVVFKVATDNTESILYSFCARYSCTDGADPTSSVIVDAAGNVYGTTYDGGAHHCRHHQRCGAVFKIAPDGSETVLYAFDFAKGDGTHPADSGLVMDARSDVYGTTPQGGGTGCGGEGCGAAFEITPTGKERRLYSFCSQTNCSDGYNPLDGLVLFKDVLYGTAAEGGAHGQGAVFSIAH